MTRSLTTKQLLLSKLLPLRVCTGFQRQNAALSAYCAHAGATHSLRGQVRGGGISITGWTLDILVTRSACGINHVVAAAAVTIREQLCFTLVSRAPLVPLAPSRTARRTFKYIVMAPASSWYLKRVVGIAKGASAPGKEVAGTVSIKAIYEIAKSKQQVRALEWESAHPPTLG